MSTGFARFAGEFHDPALGPDQVKPGGGIGARRLVLLTNTTGLFTANPSVDPAARMGSLPVGLQLIGNYFQEGTLLHAAHALQQATDWHTRAPAGF